MKVYLSPSSQTENSYAGGLGTEAQWCSVIADKAKNALTRCGISVKKATAGYNIDQRVTESNAYAPDLHLPIHTNAGGGQGTLVMVYSQQETNLAPARAILNSVAAITLNHYKYSIATRTDLAELANTSAIATYLEVEFHDRADLAQWITTHTTEIGEAITKGVCSWKGIPYTIVDIDTTTDVTKSAGQTYIFKTTSPQTPTVTVGTSGVVSLTHLYREGQSDYWQLLYVGTSGSAAGIYTAGSGESPLKRFVARVA
jgi:hypothetical protein